MWPMDFIRLADHHTDTVLPLILGSKFGIRFIVVLALISLASFMEIQRTGARLVELTETVVFRAEMPVDLSRKKECEGWNQTR